MACSSKTVTGSGVALSHESASTTVFMPLTGWVSTTEVKKVRASTEMRASTNTAQIAPAYQIADDIDAPGTVTQIGGTFRTTEGIDYQTSFTDVSSVTDTKLFVRFGVLCKSASAGVKGCLASIRIDIQGP